MRLKPRSTKATLLTSRIGWSSARRGFLRLAGVAALVTLGSCQADITGLVAFRRIGQVTAVQGDAQVVAAGTTAADIKIRIVDTATVPWANLLLTVKARSGTAAQLPAQTVTTDANGVATITGWRVDTLVGRDTLTVTAFDASRVFVATTATIAPQVPAAVVVTAGSGQSAAVAAAVATAPTVRVTDRYGNVVPGVAVRFTTTGTGALRGLVQAIPSGAFDTVATVTTGSTGVAILTAWRLGQGIGGQGLAVAVPAFAGLSATMSATATAGPVATLTKAAGDAQTAVAGSVLPVAPQVMAMDAFGNPVANATINFSVTTGGGVLTGATATTTASGAAALGAWRLGNAAGANVLQAQAASGTTVTFTASGIAGPPRAIVISQGDQQNALVSSAVPLAPTVVVSDSLGNPVAGVSVTFAITSGGGQLTAPTTTTLANGRAAVGAWKLGNVMGANSLTATASGVPVAPITFSATAQVKGTIVLANVSKLGRTDSSVPTSPSVLVKDSAGNVVVGAPVVFAVSAGGGVATGATQPTDGGGIAQLSSWTLGGTVSTNSVVASSAFVAASPLTINVGVAKQLGSSGYGACVLSTTGEAFCWGYGPNGFVGDGSLVQNRPFPGQVGGGLQFPGQAGGGGLVFTKIAVGFNHACALASDSTAYCWGSNANGQVGTGSFTASEPLPKAVVGGIRFADIFSGNNSSFTCGATGSGALYCWGLNASGQLGDGSQLTRSVPVLSNPGRTFTAVATGGNHACGISTAGAALCWGAGDRGQFGDSTLTALRTQANKPVYGGIIFTALTAGATHSCGLSSAKEIWCWGSNDYSQIGTSSFPQGASAGLPFKANTVALFSALGAGTYTTCGITTTGSTLCWGNNVEAELGVGNVSVVAGGYGLPNPVGQSAGGPNAAIAGGLYHGCSLGINGNVWCWGAAGYGAFGNGATGNGLQLSPSPASLP